MNSKSSCFRLYLSTCTLCLKNVFDSYAYTSVYVLFCKVAMWHGPFLTLAYECDLFLTFNFYVYSVNRKISCRSWLTSWPHMLSCCWWHIVVDHPAGNYQINCAFRYYPAQPNNYYIVPLTSSSCGNSSVYI